MALNRVAKTGMRIAILLVLAYLGLTLLIYSRQRSLLYFPSHGSPSTVLKPWTNGTDTIGYHRPSPRPKAVWLMMHGNSGQAADREYVLNCMSEWDSLYVLEYPGFGDRPGSPTRESIEAAASEAYRLLRARHPDVPVCVIGESLGTGAASHLSREPVPPDKIVLIVPFDNLASVAAEKFVVFPVRLLIKDKWDNVESLRNYRGAVDIFGAKADAIIPVAHARALAKQIPTAHYHEITGGHDDWAEKGRVKIER